jgi:fatty-acyl-CoA synthase
MNLSTVGNLIGDLAREHGSRTALTFPELNEKYTFKQLDEVSTRVAKNLYRAGFRKGDRFAVWANNLPEWIILQFATAKIGVILLAVNTGLRRNELQYVLSQSGARGLALVRSIRGIDFVGELEAVRGQLPALKEVFVLRDDFSRLAAETDFELPEIPLDPHDWINMQYTSGTTGFPKGVMLSHHSILRNAFDAGARVGIADGDSLCLQVPLFHCLGCVTGVLGPYTHGASIVALTEFNPLRVLEAVHKLRCTAMFGVPTMFTAILNHPDFHKFDLSSLRTGLMGGAPCSREIMSAVIEKMGAAGMTCGYGLTETSPGIAITFSDDAIADRVGTVGRPLPGVEVKIVDGELLTRGYHVMLGYYNMPDETAHAMRDGWFHTGDLAAIDARGYIQITGRSKDLIIRAGENISPRESEEALSTHPLIREAYAYGVPNDFFGQEVAVAVHLKDGASLTAGALQEFCAGKLARFKIPQYVDFVTAFPTTPSGKVQKYKLAEAWVARNKR